jgi:hypothetical protein
MRITSPALKDNIIGVRGEYIYFDKIKIDNKKGYRRTLTINPITKKRQYIREHRLLFEQYYKCCLLSWSDVHHKNGNPIDNSKENLEGMMHYKHTIIHNPRIDRSNRNCVSCGLSKTRVNKQGSDQWYSYKNGFVCASCYIKRYKAKYRS